MNMNSNNFTGDGMVNVGGVHVGGYLKINMAQQNPNGGAQACATGDDQKTGSTDDPKPALDSGQTGAQVPSGPFGHPLIPSKMIPVNKNMITEAHTKKFWPWSWMLDPNHDRHKDGWSVKLPWSKPGGQIFGTRIEKLRDALTREGGQIATDYHCQLFREFNLQYRGGSVENISHITGIIKSVDMITAYEKMDPMIPISIVMRLVHSAHTPMELQKWFVPALARFCMNNKTPFEFESSCNKTHSVVSIAFKGKKDYCMKYINDACMRAFGFSLSLKEIGETRKEKGKEKACEWTKTHHTMQVDLCTYANPGKSHTTVLKVDKQRHPEVGKGRLTRSELDYYAFMFVMEATKNGMSEVEASHKLTQKLGEVYNSGAAHENVIQRQETIQDRGLATEAGIMADSIRTQKRESIQGRGLAIQAGEMAQSISTQKQKSIQDRGTAAMANRVNNGSFPPGAGMGVINQFPGMEPNTNGNHHQTLALTMMGARAGGMQFPHQMAPGQLLNHGGPWQQFNQQFAKQAHMSMGSAHPGNRMMTDGHPNHRKSDTMPQNMPLPSLDNISPEAAYPRQTGGAFDDEELNSLLAGKIGKTPSPTKDLSTPKESDDLLATPRDSNPYLDNTPSPKRISLVCQF